MWRPETQADWLGPESSVDLHAGRRCALSDEAGPWRTATVVRAMRPSEVVFDAAGVEIKLAIAGSEDGGSVLTISHADDGDDTARFWSRRVEFVAASSAASRSGAGR